MIRLTFFATLLLLFLSGCAPQDPCKDLPCGVEGSCRDGICECAVGFEGENCELREIDKFLGTYLRGRGYCNFSQLELSTHVISEHPYDHQTILIDDGALDYPILGLVEGWNFTILPQTNSYTDTLTNFHEEFEIFGQGWLDLEGGKLVYQLDNSGCRYELELN